MLGQECSRWSDDEGDQSVSEAKTDADGAAIGRVDPRSPEKPMIFLDVSYNVGPLNLRNRNKMGFTNNSNFTIWFIVRLNTVTYRIHGG